MTNLNKNEIIHSQTASEESSIVGTHGKAIQDDIIEISSQNISHLKDYAAQYDQTDNGLVLGQYFFVFKNKEYEYSSTCCKEVTQYLKELYNTHKTADKLMITLRTDVENQDGDCLSVLDEVILWESPQA